MPETRNTFKFEVAGAQTVGTGKDRWQAPFPGEIVDVSIAVGTAPTGSSLIFDIKKNGTTIYPTSTKPQVAIGALESADATVFKPDTTVFAKGDTFSLDVTQIGSTVAGSDADVVVEYISS